MSGDDLITFGVPGTHDDATVLRVVSDGVHDLLQLVHALTRVVWTQNHRDIDYRSHPPSYTVHYMYHLVI